MGNERVIAMTEEQLDRLYDELYERVNSLGFGYGRNNGDEYVMLRRFYTPEDARFFLDMPTDRFFSAEEFADIEGVGADEAVDILNDMARRANIYHEKDAEGNDRYHVIPAAHGIYEFHQRWFDSDWLVSSEGSARSSSASTSLMTPARFRWIRLLGSTVTRRSRSFDVM